MLELGVLMLKQETKEYIQYKSIYMYIYTHTKYWQDTDKMFNYLDEATSDIALLP